MAEGDHIEIKTGDVTDSAIIGKLVINAPPQAKARGELVANKQKEGDTYLTRMVLHIEAPYAAQRLRVDAYGSSIAEFGFYEPPRQIAQGLTMSGGLEQMVFGNIESAHAWKQLDRPAPAYWIDVRTKQAETPHIEVTLT